MIQIKDFYTDEMGRKFEPQDVGNSLVFLRSVHRGAVTNLVVPYVNGELDFHKAKEFREKSQALTFIYNQEGRMPERFVNSRTREILKRYEQTPKTNGDMKQLLDFYVIEETGEKLVPQTSTDQHVYLRGNRAGNIRHIVCKRDAEGQPNIKQPVRIYNNGWSADEFLREQSEGISEKFVPSETRRRIAEAKGGQS